jgi:hypothetical protein
MSGQEKELPHSDPAKYAEAVRELATGIRKLYDAHCDVILSWKGSGGGSEAARLAHEKHDAMQQRLLDMAQSYLDSLPGDGGELADVELLRDELEAEKSSHLGTLRMIDAANTHPVEIVEAAKEYMRHKAEWKAYISGELKSSETVMDYISRIQLLQDKLCNYFAKMVIDLLTPATGGDSGPPDLCRNCKVILNPGLPQTCCGLCMSCSDEVYGSDDE